MMKEPRFLLRLNNGREPGGARLWPSPVTPPDGMARTHPRPSDGPWWRASVGSARLCRLTAAATRCLAGLLCAVWLTGCATHRPPQRHAWVTGLKPEKAAYYRELHANPWPAVNRMLKECHIRNFSIHECEIEGRLFLFAYLEYTGQDYDADMKRMAADPETQRWWKETDPCQSPLPPAAAQGKIWADTKEVYFLR